jgi:Trypsin
MNRSSKQFTNFRDVITRMSPALLAWLIVFAMDQPALAISNGELVSEEDPVAPVTVSVYSESDDCTGIKIAPSLILTARHCEINRTTRVIFSDSHSYPLARYFTPIPKYTGNDFDGAIVEIDGVVPGPVARLGSTFPNKKSAVWVAGYGGSQITNTSNPLRKLQVEIGNWDYSRFAISVQTKNGGGVCDGDSGGPGYTIMGDQVVVWGMDSASVSGNSRCASQELYTKLIPALSWISKIMAAFGPKQMAGRTHL